MPNVPRTAALLIEGYDIQDSGEALTPSHSLAVTFDATGTGISDTSLAFLDVTNDVNVSIASDHAGTVTGGTNVFNQIAETDNSLTTVTLSGPQPFVLGGEYAGFNTDDGVVTDIGATATSLTTIHSSLKLIDASATTGGVTILAGATNTSGAGTLEHWSDECGGRRSGYEDQVCASPVRL
jgi:hypothetical protein